MTYNGLALYRYAPDHRAGDAKGQGLEREWYAIAPTGKIVTRKQATSTPPVSTPPPAQDPPDEGYYG